MRKPVLRGWLSCVDRQVYGCYDETMTNTLHKVEPDFYTFFEDGKEFQVEKTTNGKWTVFAPDSKVVGSFDTLSEVRAQFGLDG